MAKVKIAKQIEGRVSNTYTYSKWEEMYLPNVRKAEELRKMYENPITLSSKLLQSSLDSLQTALRKSVQK
jgi:hypothetical protein